MSSTVRMSATEIYKDWHIIDAADQPLGRVASEVAKLVIGKHKPTFEPHLDDGDYVIVLNAAKVRLTGRKREQMVYYRHSGYPGGLKSRSFEQQMERFPETILERAINGMLPKGALGQKMRGHVKIYAGAEHPHHGQMAGMEEAVAERQAASQASVEKLTTAPKPPPRLRPLAIPQGVAEAAAAEAAALEATTVVEPGQEVEEAPKPKRRTAKKDVVEPAEDVAVREPEPEIEEEEAPKPKRRAAKKVAVEPAEDVVVAEPEAEAEIEEVAPKPKRRTAKKKPVAEEATEAATAEKPAPKPRTRRKKADVEEAEATPAAEESEPVTETEE